MFTDIVFSKEQPMYIQLRDYIKNMILKGMLQEGQKLPSTRELSASLSISRNTITAAYSSLEDEELIETRNGLGAYVAVNAKNSNKIVSISWEGKMSHEAKTAEQLDIMKHGITFKKGMIAFTSIAPDESYFNLENVKRAFLDRISLDDKKILNYGYAKGYKPLMDYLLKYMGDKGLDLEGKDILITNGFTEAFDLMLTALCDKGDKVICENPTHNTAIKIMKIHGLVPVGITMEQDGIKLSELSDALSLPDNNIKMAYLTPSYHNPTGIIMSPKKRTEALKILNKHNMPVVEDGFNEELRYSGSHVAPLIACNGKSNNVIYAGSFSKVLFPGLRIGWLIGDKDLINYVESLKRSRNIHTSVLDQALLYQYLEEGNFERYIKKVRKIYKEKYELAVSSAKEFIPCQKISGEGGLHIFIELEPHINSRDVLDECAKRGVVFTPGDIFFSDGMGQSTFRIGFSRVKNEDIEKGIKIIGDVIREVYL